MHTRSGRGTCCRKRIGQSSCVLASGASCCVSLLRRLMDSEAVTPPSASSSSSSSVVAGPSSLWRLAERRTRKAGTGNIFGGVNLWQLQRLFRAAGDQDAEQRAQLVWGDGDEAELAQALIGLRARSHRRGRRTEGGRDALGSRWLRSFNHLRIGESAAGIHGMDPEEDSDSEVGAHSNPEPRTPAPAGRGDGGAVGMRSRSQGPTGTSDRLSRSGPGLRSVTESEPDRYLHRILH